MKMVCGCSMEQCKASGEIKSHPFMSQGRTGEALVSELAKSLEKSLGAGPSGRGAHPCFEPFMSSSFLNSGNYLSPVLYNAVCMVLLLTSMKLRLTSLITWQCGLSSNQHYKAKILRIIILLHECRESTGLQSALHSVWEDMLGALHRRLDPHL